MGLSASQARLLTITSRKSDCEFQSMRYSHEKIALSRAMTDISNEYQNSLNQTKLIYDYYGTNDKSLGVSYGLFMKPSEMNGYMPIITTDSSGKVVLDSKYAAAARNAGIPAEGLGCLPSDLMRNRFLEGLANTNEISQVAFDNYKNITYSQSAGVGSIEAVNTVSSVMTYNDLVKSLSSVMVDLDAGANFDSLNEEHKNFRDYCGIWQGTGNEAARPGSTTVSVADVLNEDYTLTLFSGNDHTYGSQYNELKGIALLQQYWTMDGNGGYELLEALKNALCVDAKTKAAAQYADSKIATIVNLHDNFENYDLSKDDVEDHVGNNAFGWVTTPYGEHASFTSDNTKWASQYIGYTLEHCRAYDHKWKYATIAINLGNILKSYLTYFADAMNNFEGKYFVDETVSVQRSSKYRMSTPQTRSVKESKLVGGKNEDGSINDCKFEVVTSKTVDTTNALMSSFYDAIFNQICLRGWVENDNVINADYLQDMYKNGMMFITAAGEDGFYYQNNYGSYSLVKEVTDDDAIARAEAKYNTEKAKITHKEEIIDLKMKNLDTEISSLTTEYDTIKSLITKNIERGFKRYEA